MVVLLRTQARGGGLRRACGPASGSGTVCMRTQFVSYENTIRERARERSLLFSHLTAECPSFSFFAPGELERQSCGATLIKRHAPRFRNSDSETNDEGLNWTAQESPWSTFVTERRRTPSCIAEIFWYAPDRSSGRLH